MIPLWQKCCKETKTEEDQEEEENWEEQILDIWMNPDVSSVSLWGTVKVNGSYLHVWFPLWSSRHGWWFIENSRQHSKSMATTTSHSGTPSHVVHAQWGYNLFFQQHRKSCLTKKQSDGVTWPLQPSDQNPAETVCLTANKSFLINNYSMVLMHSELMSWRNKCPNLSFQRDVVFIWFKALVKLREWRSKLNPPKKDWSHISQNAAHVFPLKPPCPLPL